MIAPNDSIDSQSTDAPPPNSKKIYVSGKIHSDVCVSFREIALAPTKSISGEIEVNEPVRVYDTSGPWGNPDFHGDVTRGPAIALEMDPGPRGCGRMRRTQSSAD